MLSTEGSKADKQGVAMTPASKALLSIIAREHGSDSASVDIGPNCMAKFERFDWQNYVPNDIQNVWPELSEEARLVAYFWAKEAAYLDDPAL